MGWYTYYYIYICTNTNYDPKVLLEKIKNPDQKIKNKLAARKHEMDFDEVCGYSNMTCSNNFETEIVYDDDSDKIDIILGSPTPKYMITTNQKRGDKSSLKYLVALIEESLGPDVKCIYGIYSGEDEYAEMQLMIDQGEPRTIWVDKR